MSGGGLKHKVADQVVNDQMHYELFSDHLRRQAI